MSLTAFPEPKDLALSFEQTVLDGRPKSFNQYSVENPHPGYGKDPNILNEFGHTKYPMWVYPNGNNHPGVVVNNEEEEKAAKGEQAPAPAWPTAK